MRLTFAALFALALFSCNLTPAVAADNPLRVCVSGGLCTQPSATAQVINHAIDKASDGLTQIAHALSSPAPQAWALAVKGTYAQGLSGLIVGGVSLFFGLLAALFCWFFAWRADKTNNEFFGFCAVVSGIYGIVLIVFSGINLGDSSGRAKVISPDGYLAQQILTRALN